MVDLWPNDFGGVSQRTPMSLLREQASKLGGKTNNVVEAEVIEFKSTPYWVNQDDFCYGFYLVGPLLNGYRYKSFTIAYPIYMYPLKLELDTDIATEIMTSVSEDMYRIILTGEHLFTVASEQEYIRLLGLIFKSSKMLNVINAILAHSKS